jgi:UDP-N-acetylmuramate--alanine ligase
MLGAVLARHKVAVGVIGTHGKGTVSSGIAWLLEQDGKNPAFIIGGMLHDFGRLNARLNDGSLIVAEVDESDGSLRHVHPTLMVLNNLEADHLNYYDSLEHIQDTVVSALADNPRLEHVVVNRDDPGAAALISRLQVPVTTFGREDGADVQARDILLEPMRSSFELWVRGEARGRIEVALPGLYNLDNALAAIAAGLHLGVSLGAIQRAYASFHGLENRFTVVEAGGRRVIKDYISHPTGIRRVLEAASADGRRLTAVFKPYRFTMIHYLQEDYAEAFHDASETVITELYTAGELAIPGIDTEYLCEKIRSRGPKVTYIQEMDAITEYLHAEVKDGEQVVFFGGDDLFRLADRYTDELRARAGAP